MNPIPEPGGYPPQWPPPTPPRPWRRSLVTALATVLTVAVAGVPLGLLWSWLAPSVPVGRNQQGQIVVNDPAPEQFVAADGWFALLGFGFGVLVAIAAWQLLRRYRGPLMLLAVVLGALAAALVAWQVGRRLGLADFERWQQAAAVGELSTRPPDLSAYGTLLMPAFAAVIVCTLLAGWSNDPNLDRPGALPGYGHDLPPALYPPGPYPVAPGPGDGFSSDSPVGPDPTAVPGPPGPGPATPPHG